ncbi:MULTISPECIES: hypothetical protein [unclassified Bradyrhizobium]|uniref:hypothetical protein n=1 Tax=unclassified Bradyrhizobium TaxID=2631580 RepID=UPI0024783441|nr:MULTISPECIES: hypothetical protein [unclassified Bradyrhizobium]WGS20415.1 hypothetical protein MTX22_00785 [Bradyrhizobium sp. ISRA463]WGS27295.1 hypothetical protein MTX19_37665 [Bradyrhizobium sp. ISRA464]
MAADLSWWRMNGRASLARADGWSKPTSSRAGPGNFHDVAEPGPRRFPSGRFGR